MNTKKSQYYSNAKKPVSHDIRVAVSKVYGASGKSRNLVTLDEINERSYSGKSTPRKIIKDLFSAVKGGQIEMTEKGFCLTEEGFSLETDYPVPSKITRTQSSSSRMGKQYTLTRIVCGTANPLDHK